MQAQVIRHIGQRSRSGLDTGQVLVGLEGVRHQQVMGGLAFQHIRAVIANQHVVATVAAQTVAAGAAKNVMEAAHDDVAGVCRAESAGRFLVDHHTGGVLRKIEDVARIRDLVARHIVMQAGSRIALQRAGQRSAIAHAENIAALPADGIFESLEFETESGVIPGRRHRRRGCARKTGLRHAAATTLDPAGIGAGHAQEQVRGIAGKIEDVAAAATLDQIDLVAAIGPGDAIGTLESLANAVIKGHCAGLDAEIENVAAAGIDYVGKTPTGEEAVAIRICPARHVGCPTPGDQQVVAAIAFQCSRAAV